MVSKPFIFEVFVVKSAQEDCRKIEVVFHFSILLNLRIKYFSLFLSVHVIAESYFSNIEVERSERLRCFAVAWDSFKFFTYTRWSASNSIIQLVGKCDDTWPFGSFNYLVYQTRNIPWYFINKMNNISNRLNN